MFINDGANTYTGVSQEGQCPLMRKYVAYAKRSRLLTSLKYGTSYILHSATDKMVLTSRRVHPPVARTPAPLAPRPKRPRLVARVKQNDTPLESPRSGSDSDAAYDSLRGVLSKVSLGKYFKDFRRREVRLEDLRHLTESDLTEVSLMRGMVRYLCCCVGRVCVIARFGGGSYAPHTTPRVVLASPPPRRKVVRMLFSSSSLANTTFYCVWIEVRAFWRHFFPGQKQAALVDLTHRVGSRPAAYRTA